MCDKMNKKNRGANFNKEEELLLLEEVHKERNIIECKTTNKVSSFDKEQAWNRVTEHLNSMNMICRSTDQLKSKYDNLKTKARKLVATQRTNLRATGGGPFDGDADPVVEAVLRIINMKTVVGFASEFDSDSYIERLPNEKLESFGNNSAPATTVKNIAVNNQLENEISQHLTTAGSTAHIDGASIDIITTPKATTSKDGASIDIITTPKATTSKSYTDWSRYVPKQLKEPVAKKLRQTVPNPLIDCRREYYRLKTVFIKGEIEEQRKKAEREERKEEREEEEHRKKMKLLDLEISKLDKDINKDKL